MRTLSKELKEHVGKVVTVQGWLHKKRLLGGLTFINLRDRGGLVQIVLKDKDEVEKLRGLQIGTVLQVEAMVKDESRAPGGTELHDAKLTVLVPVTEEPAIEIDKPLSHDPEHLDTLFDNRVVGLRNLQEQAIFKVQAEIVEALRQHFRSNGFTDIRTPKLLAAATEGGAEVFKIDYFGKQEATLAQSPQFYKQMMVGVFERVYEIAPVYRAEPSATTRHMSEYISVDGEMGFITLDDLQVFLSGLMNAVVDHVWQTSEPELKLWQAVKPVLPQKIPALTMAEINEKYTKATGTDTTKEKDLTPAEEKWICEWAKDNLGSEAVFVSQWPRQGAKFYHKFYDDNQEVAERIDLLFRGVEITTGSLREHRYDRLLKQLQGMTGNDPNDPGLKPFLSAMKAGMPPHGGFGMGLERLTQKFLGLKNVKEASLFPRDINRLAP
ncbi:MAG TPA: aspartate--tRNA(Asn) ligase [Candidatus Saccharimonadales bacterium]|nr:aspartate--tRNA(Asn) ligase [Candidatus Saccharimonadales bacterium]